MNLEQLAIDYEAITGLKIDFNCGGCVTRAWQTVEKYNYLKSFKMSKSDKKYILKEGNHQFFAGSPHVYNNQNLSDEEAAFFLKAHPHLKNCFSKIPKEVKEQN